MAAKRRSESSESEVFDAGWSRRAELFMKTAGVLLGDQIPSSAGQDKEKSAGSAWINHPVDRSALGNFLDPYHQAALRAKARVCLGLGLVGMEDQSRLPGNAFETFSDIISEASLNYFGVGDGYMEATRGRARKPVGLYWLPAETVEIHSSRILYRQRGPQGQFSYFRAYGAKEAPAGVPASIWGGGAWLDLHEIIHIRMPGTGSTYYGEPDWLGCLKSVMLSDNARTWYADWFENGLKLGGIIGVGKKLQKRTDLTADEKATGRQSEEEVVQSFVRQEIAGRDGKAHQWLMISGLSGQAGNTAKDALSLLPLSYQPSDALMKNILEQGRNEIVTMHNVPRLLLGIETPGKLGGSNDAAGQLLIFEVMSMSPHRRIWETRLNATLGKDLGIKFEFKGIDEEFIQSLVGLAGAPGATGTAPAEEKPADQAPTEEEIQAATRVLQKAADMGAI